MPNGATYADLPPNVQNQYDQTNTAEGQQAAEAQAQGAVGKVAAGQGISRDDAIAVIAVAAAAVPGAGWAAGAAVIVSYELAEAFAKAFFGPAAHGVDMCSSDQPGPSGPNDPNWIHVIAHPGYVELTSQANGTQTVGKTTDFSAGSFEAFAVPALLLNYEMWINCRNNVDPWKLLDALIAKWNSSHDAGAPSKTYAANQGNSYLAYYMRAADGSTYPTFSVAVGGAVHAPPPSTTSTGTKVATGAAVVGGTALAATLVYSYFTGKAVTTVLDKLWEGAKKAVRRV